MVGRIPRAPVFAPVRTRTLSVKANGSTSTTYTTVIVDQWRPDIATVIGLGVLDDHRNFRGYHRLEFGRSATTDHHLVVYDVVGQHGFVVHEVKRRGGHRGRRGSVVD